MASIHVDFLEHRESWYFALDSKDNKEYLYKTRTGLQQRDVTDKRITRTLELKTTGEAKALIQPPVTASILKTRRKEIDFNTAKILRDNQMVLDTLHRLKPMEWRVIFRANHTGRIVLRKKKKEQKWLFTYYSILVKLRLKDRRDFIEIGEGSVRDLKFNLDGLTARLNNIVDNHRRGQTVRFPEKVPVILNSGDGAIMFHELLGHSLEADYIFRGQSPIKPGDIGKRMFSPNVTLLSKHKDDTFFKDIPCDDEGETNRPEVLVEQGVPKHVIADGFYKEKLQLRRGGHGRSEDFTKPLLPRNFALYLKPGAYHPDELTEATRYGVYAREFGDGKVFFNRDLFRFHIRDARLIENGKLTVPLGSVTVQGNIFETLNSVDMIANDFRFDKGISYCYKDGQTVNVRVGQPTVKIDNLRVTPYKGVQ
jgi:predicted Zn-dependent protease